MPTLRYNTSRFLALAFATVIVSWLLGFEVYRALYRQAWAHPEFPSSPIEPSGEWVWLAMVASLVGYVLIALRGFGLSTTLCHVIVLSTLGALQIDEGMRSPKMLALTAKSAALGGVMSGVVIAIGTFLFVPRPDPPRRGTLRSWGAVIVFAGVLLASIRYVCREHIQELQRRSDERTNDFRRGKKVSGTNGT